MKRFLATSALLSLLVLPVVGGADDQPRMPRETKWSSEPAASVPADNDQQKRRVESSTQATDATTSPQVPDTLRRSVEQYNVVNPSAITD